MYLTRSPCVTVIVIRVIAIHSLCAYVNLVEWRHLARRLCSTRMSPSNAPSRTIVVSFFHFKSLTGSVFQPGAVLFPKHGCCLRITPEFLFLSFFGYAGRCILLFLVALGRGHFASVLYMCIFYWSDMSLHLQQHKIGYHVDRAIISIRHLGHALGFPSRHVLGNCGNILPLKSRRFMITDFQIRFRLNNRRVGGRVCCCVCKLR